MLLSVAVISQLGTVIVDGKPYPPAPSTNGPPRQQPSPNMAPPLRPGLPPGIPAGMPPTGPPGGYGPQNGPPIYNNSASAQQQFNNMQMNRNYAAEGAGKGTPACRSQFITTPISFIS